MSAMGDLAADRDAIARLTEGPQPPSLSLPARIVFHDGHIWRRGDLCWSTLEPADPHLLLELYRKDAKAFDWFAPKAAQLADELEHAMREAGIIKAKRKAA